MPKPKPKSAKMPTRKPCTETTPPLQPDYLSALPLELLRMIAYYLIPNRTPSEKANPDMSYRAMHKLALQNHWCAKADYESQSPNHETSFSWSLRIFNLNFRTLIYPHAPPRVFPEIDGLRALVRTSKTMHVMLQPFLDYEKDPLECAIARGDGLLALKVLGSVECDQERLLLLMKGAKSKTRGLVWKGMVKNGAAKGLGREWVSMMRDEWS